MSIAPAIRLLTVVPVPGGADETDQMRARATVWFPAVGAALGAAAWGIDWTLRLAVHPNVAAAIAIAALAIFTGFVHLDGLGDTADATFGHRSGERRLALMRDPRLGAFGVAAIVLVIIVKWAALSSAADPARLVALVSGGAASRWTAALALRMFPIARPDGQAAAFGRVGLLHVVGASVIAVAIVVGAFQAAGAVIAAIALVTVVGIGAAYTRLLGGLTGDVYGAIIELSEAAAWVAAPLVVQWALFVR